MRYEDALHCFSHEDAKKQEVVALCGQRGGKITQLFKVAVDCPECRKAMTTVKGKEEER